MSKKGFTYTLQIDAEINDLIAKTNAVKKSMESIMSAGKAPGAEKIFGSIERAIERLQQKAAQPIESVAAFTALEKDVAAVGVQLRKLGSVIDDFGNMSLADKMDLLPPDLKKQIEDASAAFAAFSKAQAQAAQKSQTLIDAENDLVAAQKELKKAEGRVQEKQALIQAQQALVDSAHDEADAIKAKIDALKKYQATAAAYEAAGGDKRKAGGGKEELAGLNLPADRTAAKKAAPGLDLGNAQAVADEITRLGDAYSQASKAVTDAESTQRRYSKQLNEANNAAVVASGKVTALQQSVTQLNQEFEKDKAKNVQAAYTKLRTEAGKLGVDLTNIPIDYTEQNLIELNNAMNNLAADGLAKVDQGNAEVKDSYNELNGAVDQTTDALTRNKEVVEGLDERAKDTQAFATRIKQFVGLQGAANLARKAFQNAFSTIQELDKAMTEMAVVTELDVGDYWERLPKYTKQANALGVSIKGAYEAATLYYQQGLKTNEVTAMSNETLKMARIAGLSAEDATNKMTAALRGFNMELNETSAQRIADVYSELAAITASDVDEISSAMTKTASIAASAGMEFETTAAFLSQIIETTRESAETAGTAMKTVIARFQELKKDPAEIGEVDGEVVDANKIETALRSVGVALRDTSGQFRDLDDVFLELSGKWDSLDTNTQRYIATIAAGSRQQSRFIAMMSDYSRTQELVTAANTSAGASNEQFEKTLESLDSKLNNLKNSWDTFTMSLMNNEVVKIGIDILTALMDTINGVVALFDRFGLGSAASIGMVIAALYLGAKALNSFETHMMAVDAKGKRLNTTLGSIRKVGAEAFNSMKKAAQNTVKTIKGLPKEIQKVGVAAKASAKNINKMQSSQFIKAREAYAAATKEAADAENHWNMVSMRANATSAQMTAADQRLMASRAGVTASEAALFAAMELTDDQKKEAAALSLAGVSADTAAMLAKYGLTSADVAQYAATNNLTTAQAAETLASQIGAKATLGETVGKWLNVAATKMQEKADKGGILAKAASTVATWLQTAANWALQASMWPILLIGLAIIAAIAILVGLVLLLVSAFKKAKANSPEGKLEAAKTAAEVAGEAADKAKEAYDGLADSFDSLSDKYAGLEDLTKGSREWRDAVKEINDEVLNLVDQYPELAGLVENEGGVLTLDVDGAEAQAVLDEYEARAMKASSAEIAAKISVSQAQNAVDYKNLSDDATVGSEAALVWQKIGAGALMSTGALGGILGGAAIWENANEQAAQNKQDTEALAQALAEGLVMQQEDGSWSATEGSDEALQALGLTAEAAAEMANELGDGAVELREYGKAVAQRTEQEKALYEALALNAVQMVDTAKMTEEEQKQVSVAANADYAKLFEEQAKNSIDAKTAGMSDDEYAEYATQKAKELYGTEDVEVDKDGNVTVGKGDDAKTVSSAEFEKQLAASEATENAAAALENLPKAINSAAAKMGKAGQALEKSYMADEGKAMTRGDIESLKSYSNAELESVYNSLSAAEQQAFGSYENFQKHIQDSIKLGEEAFNTASNTLNQMGAVVQYNEKMTGETAQGYADQLEYIMQGAGQAGVDQVNNALNSLAGSMNDEELNKFMGQLNAMDWKNMDSWEELPDLLKEVGLNVPEAELEKFIKVASDTAGAVKAIDLEALNEQMLNLQSLSSKIKSGEQGRNISSSDYEALVAADPDLAGKFQQTLDGEFVYLGGSMDELTAAISANTEALLAQATEQLQNKVDAAELMQDMAKSWSWSDGTKADISKWKSWEDDASASNATGYLNSFISEANKSGMDLSQLGIAGLSNDTDVTKMTEEQINAMMDSLVGVFNDFETNSELLMEKTVNALSLSYQNRDATSNSMEATNLRNIVARGGSLNEDQQVAMKASSNAITAQAVTAGVNGQDIGKYTDMVANMEAVQESYKRGEISLKQFKQQYSAFAKEAEAFERQVVNKTNLNKMNSSLQATMETVGELGERFDKLKDEGTKIEVVAQIVEQFGIQVNESNYKAIGELATTMAAGGEAGYQAFEQLMVQAGAAYGLTLDQVSNMSMQTWNDSTKKMSTDMQAFADSMIASGAAMWQEMADGSKKFVWATQNNLMDATEAAGTALEAWENPYTWLYNYNEEINRLTREREKLERAYEKAAEDSTKTAQELANITAAELNQLKKEAEIQKYIAAEAASNAAKKRKENSEYSGLYSFNATTGEIQVNWKKVDRKGWTEDERAAFEDFISYLEEQGNTIREAQDGLEDIQDSVEEIEKRGRDATSSIYNQVKEGLVKQYESELDALEALNNSIQEASEAMLTKMQEQIDEARQARDNEKTQNEIADKEIRLAYLMRDTSGGNAVEIAELQKEIEEDKQSHTDSLVDQAIEKLSRENEKAAEQREKQLELQRAQLEAYVNSAAIWNDVKQLVDAGFAAVANGTAFKNTTAGQLAASGADVNTLNPFEKEDFYMELERSAKEGAIHEGFVGIQGKGSVTSISSLADSISETIGGLKMDVTTTTTGTVITTSVPAYKEGGLADYTGPAWLDGTKSKPEIVLNQTDSANFMQLRDILADILQGTSDLSGAGGKAKGGDNYYEVEINVESISDDYDVEQMAEKIKSMIYNDASYRNVNAVNIFR